MRGGCDVHNMGVRGSRQMKLMLKGLRMLTVEHVGPHKALTWYPLINPYMEITCAPLPKTLRSRSLNFTISSTRKVPIFKGSQLALHHYKKTKTRTSLRYVKILLVLVSLSSWRFFNHKLNHRRVFGQHPIGALCWFFVLLFFIFSIGAWKHYQLTNDFCESSIIFLTLLL